MGYPTARPDGLFYCSFKNCATGRNLRGFRERRKRDQHIKTVHLKLREFECPHCGDSFSSNYNQQRHVKNNICKWKKNEKKRTKKKEKKRKKKKKKKRRREKEKL